VGSVAIAKQMTVTEKDRKGVLFYAGLFCVLGIGAAGLAGYLMYPSYSPSGADVLWTLAFVVSASLVAAMFGWWAPPISALLLAALSIALGATEAVAWLWVVTKVLGPFSLNLGSVGTPWAVGASSAAFAAALRLRRRSRRGLQWAFLLGLVVLLPVAISPAEALLTGYRDVRLVFLRWAPDQQNRGLIDPLGILSSDDTRALEEADIIGAVEVDHAVTLRSGLPPVSVYILMRGPLDGQVLLPYPFSGSVLYLQGGHAWDTIPPDAKLTSRGVLLFTGPSDDTYFRAEHLGGALSEGGAMSWP